MFESTYRKLLEAGMIKAGERHTIVPDPQPAPGGFKGLDPETVAIAMGPAMTEWQGSIPITPPPEIKPLEDKLGRIRRDPEDFVEDFNFPHADLEAKAIALEEKARRARGRYLQALHEDREADVDAAELAKPELDLDNYLNPLWEAANYPETAPCPAPAPMPSNPKQIYGDQKVPLHFVPAASTIHEAQAFKEGARKYKAFNWRLNAVEAMTYIGAALRHIAAYTDGEDFDPEITEPTHHLGLAKACLGIILDSYETGNLIDNRPPKGVAADLLRDLKVGAI